MKLLTFLLTYLLLLQTFLYTENCVERPKYKVLRYDEDWSFMRCKCPCPPPDWADKIKYIPLNRCYPFWLSLGGQIRFREEIWNHFDFKGGNNDEFLLSRFLLHGDLHLGNNVRAFVQIKSSDSTDRNLPGGKRILDVDVFAFQNAFLELTFPFEDSSVSLLLGRREMLFGIQRLVSPLDWSNTRRTFDGGSLVYKTSKWTTTGFYTHEVKVRKYALNPASADKFYGIHAAGKPSIVDQFDLYFFGRERPHASYNDILNKRENRYTVGARVADKINDTNFDYDAEVAYQWGKFYEGNISAYMFALSVGYECKQKLWKPEFKAGFNYATGDHRLGDGDTETFSQLFPLGHAFLGWIDLIGRQNIIATNQGIILKPFPEITWFTYYHWFWRADVNDALYNAGAAIIRPAGSSNARYIGSEFDTLINYQVSRHWLIYGGYSYFFAGDFVKQTTPAASKNSSFFYLCAQMTF